MMILGTLSIESLIGGKLIHWRFVNLIVVETVRSFEVEYVGGTLVLSSILCCTVF